MCLNSQVAQYSTDDVADKAIFLLKECYTNLGPRLQSNQVCVQTIR